MDTKANLESASQPMSARARNLPSTTYDSGVAASTKLAKAVRTPLPHKLAPQLATLAREAPKSGTWIIENKFDGYRLLARIEGGKAKLLTRNGHDWTAKLKHLAADLEVMGVDNAWLDGEIVVVNDSGLPDFNGLQNAIDNTRSSRIQYFVFDLPFFDGHDLRNVALSTRRDVLRGLLKLRPTGRIHFSDAFDAAPARMLQAACELGLEGIMLKRADSPYFSGRSDTWLKLKCQQQQQFVVVGFTDRAHATAEIGSLLLGYYEDGRLCYAGSVGTGWNAALARQLHTALEKLKILAAPFEAVAPKPGRWSKRMPGSEQWVRPVMVVDVAFSEWTPQGHVRHPTFRGVVPAAPL